MDTFSEKRHENLFLRAVDKAVKDAPQTVFKPGMQVININDEELEVYEIIITSQTHVIARPWTNEDEEEKQTYIFLLSKLIHVNEILVNYQHLAEKFKKPAVNHH